MDLPVQDILCWEQGWYSITDPASSRVYCIYSDAFLPFPLYPTPIFCSMQHTLLLLTKTKGTAMYVYSLHTTIQYIRNLSDC